MRLLLTLIVVGVVNFVGVVELFALTKDWDKGGSGNLWSTSQNWSPDGVPVSGDWTVIGRLVSGAVNKCVVDSTVTNAQCGQLSVGYKSGTGYLDVTGGSLTASGSIGVGHWASSTCKGVLTVTDGNLTCPALFLGAASGCTGQLVQAGGVINATYTVFVPGQWTSAYGIGDVNLTGGVLNCGDLVMQYGNAGRVNFSGGTMRVAGYRLNDILQYYKAGLITVWGGTQPKGDLDATLDAHYAYFQAVIRPNNVPTPADTNIIYHTPSQLTWIPDSQIVNGQTFSYKVYLGTEYYSVNSATTSTAGIFKATVLSPQYIVTDTLSPGVTYFWRVDIVDNSTSKLYKGRIWRFKIQPRLAGDFNGDLFVDFNDLNGFVNHWLTDNGSGGFDNCYDLDGSGKVNQIDYSAFASHWEGSAAPAVEVNVQTQSVLSEISPYLTGSCINMAYDTDAIWQDGIFRSQLQAISSGFLRYPDTGDMWHWQECPGAPAWKDSWETNPASQYYFADHSVCNSNATMGVEDYFALVQTIGAEPLVQLNFQSGLRYNRLNDSLTEAKALVQYCKDHGYNIQYWELGSEPFGYSVTQQADVINQWVPQLKAIDPNIKIVYDTANNYSNSWTQNQWNTLFALAGQHIDVVDMHHYWHFTDGQINIDKRPSWDKFINENPLIHDYWENTSFEQEINGLRQMIKQNFNKDVEVAITEWNCGPAYGDPVTAYQYGIVRAAMMMQLIEAKVFMASVWPGRWDESRQCKSSYADPVTKEPRPAFYVLEMYSNILGQKQVACTSSQLKIPTIAALRFDGKKMWVYLVNKFNQDKTTRISLSGCSVAGITAKSMMATNDDIYRDDCLLVDQSINVRADSAYIILPRYSFTMVTIDLN